MLKKHGIACQDSHNSGSYWWHTCSASAHNGHQVKAPPFIPVAFAPYTLEQYAEIAGARFRQSPSINVLIDEYYAGTEWRDAMEGVRAPLRKALQTQRDRHKRKAELLQQSLAASEEAAQFRLQADLLLAYQHEVPRGQNSVALRNFFEAEWEDSAAEVIIPLDPRFDAVGNANRLYRKYHKLRRATALIPPQIEQNALELATIEQLLTDLMLADTPAEVVLVKAEVQAAGLIHAAAPVDYTLQRHVRHMKGGSPGMVFYERERTIYARPEGPA